jgi:hypothetical protein
MKKCEGLMKLMVSGMALLHGFCWSARSRDSLDVVRDTRNGRKFLFS